VMRREVKAALILNVPSQVGHCKSTLSRCILELCNIIARRDYRYEDRNFNTVGLESSPGSVPA
jgi:translation elongation factor EF-4